MHLMDVMNIARRTPFCALAPLVAAAWIGLSSVQAEAPSHVRGADELFWVPTLEQALEMAGTTGRPLFLMGYSLVGDGTSYTKIADDYCTGVF